jgi:hypothetical protein
MQFFDQFFLSQNRLFIALKKYTRMFLNILLENAFK